MLASRTAVFVAVTAVFFSSLEERVPDLDTSSPEVRAELAPLYDIWLPMSYQSDRKADSGYRDAYRYAAENIDRMRAHLGSNVPVQLQSRTVASGIGSPDPASSAADHLIR